MSASRDQSQKIAFVYSNFYHLYRKAKTANKGSVLKAADLRSPAFAQIQVKAHRPVEFIQKRVEPQTSSASESTARAQTAVQGLRTQLNSLNRLQSRLQFLLKEIEEYSKN